MKTRDRGQNDGKRRGRQAPPAPPIPIVHPGDVISLKKRYYFGEPEPDVVVTVIYVNPVPINQDAVDRRYPMHYASTAERMNALRLRTNKYVWSTEVVDRSGMIVPVGLTINNDHGHMFEMVQSSGSTR